MLSAYMLDDEKKKIARRMKSVLHSAHIYLTSTERTKTFLETLEEKRPDVVFMSYKSLGCRIKSLQTFVNRIRDLNPSLPALLLLEGKLPWKGLIKDKLFDVVSCERVGFSEEVAFRATRLVAISKDLESANLKRLVGASGQNRNPFLNHLVPELHNPESGRLDASKVAKMFAIPLNHVADILKVGQATVHKTPDAPALQVKLQQLERIAIGLLHLAGSKEGLRMWLRAPNRDLDEKIPLDVLREGRGEIVSNLLEDILLGQPA